MLDVVTLGEAMLRLSAPPGESLESAAHYEARIAGAEANVAATLARLGVRTGWVSKLAADPIGRRIAGELRRHGVDTSAVVWTPEGRNGVYYLEMGPAPRGTSVYYDRAGSAASTLEIREVDWAYVRQARWAHVTGITPALSEAAAAVAERLAAEVRAAGAHLSVDVNHRRKLWTAARARPVLERLVAGADLVVVARDDLQEVFEMDGAGPDLAEQARRRFGAGILVLTSGAEGAYLAEATGVHHEPAVPVVNVDPIGRGDALTAGVLWGLLEGNARLGLRYGVALAALAQTFRGDVAWVTREDVWRVLAGGSGRPSR